MTAFELLHPEVQCWIWNQGWTELRDLQEQAVDPILRGDTDVIIAASTASGKTEAAFFPIASSLAWTPESELVLYLSPLKALINDQFQRLDPFFEHLNMPAFPWHGDVSPTRKKGFRNEGRGLLLITPESLEALFVSHGHQIHYLFRNLRYVVIDELHSFIGTERGKQLQSLLHRLEIAIERWVPRIGLSATLGELSLAANYMRPCGTKPVHIIKSNASGQELKLLVRGYEEATPSEDRECLKYEFNSDEGQTGSAPQSIANDLYRVLRGTDNLVFANSRGEVEAYADLLNSRCEQERQPTEFWAHHGSLSKELREHAEERLKDKSRPATAICTSTPELGIDIGSVKSVVQIGSPFSVASLRQRLGRSGRRNEPAILRLYVREACLNDQTSTIDAMRAETVQSIALIRLLLARWCEPPEVEGIHLATLVHQVLSLIAERGGILASNAWKILCGCGPFSNVSRKQFAALLRELGCTNLLLQAADGLLLLGPAGERIVNHYSFYTVFQTPKEYRILTDSGKRLGTLPLNYAVRRKMLIIFAGQRWQVVDVEPRQRIIQVRRASGGKVPRFSGTGGAIHDRVRQEMRTIYEETEVPGYLDAQASEFLMQGRLQYHQLGIREQQVVSRDGSSFLFLWRGDRIMNTVCVQLQSVGLSTQSHGIALEVQQTTAARLREEIRRLVDAGPADAIALARTVANKETEKLHSFLSDELLSADYAASKLDSTGAWQALAEAIDPGRESRGNLSQPHCVGNEINVGASP